MGKKRVIQKSGDVVGSAGGADSRARSRRHVERAVIYVLATYNNTLISVTDENGNLLVSSSAGAIGFSGAKKATPYAAARVAETVMDKARRIEFRDAEIRVSGVGSGRDAAIRAFMNRGINVVAIRDITPVPHNGPRAKKVRRV